MLLDRFGRVINYLRISVTDKCNLKCSYCIPEREFVKIPKEEILSLEEIALFVKEASELGITKVRLTGGEPLFRKNIEKLVFDISQIKSIKDISITTNGTLLKNYAKELKNAGLSRINISLDTLNPLLFKEITGGGNLSDVLEGIETAKSVGLTPIKINCVILPFVSDEERKKIKNFCQENNLQLQFINYMNLREPKSESDKNNRAERPPKCSMCNKIRLTADGKIYPCLFSQCAVEIRKEKSFKDAILKAVELKEKEGQKFPLNAMASIGG